MSRGRDTVILSCVGGGPMQRLADHLPGASRPAAVVARYEPETWRQLAGRGRFDRLRLRVGTFLAFPFQAVWSLARRKPRVAVVTTNPFFLPALAVLTRRLHRTPVVALVYDLYPDAFEMGRSTWLRRRASAAAAAMNRYLFRRADGVVFIGPGMAARTHARYGPPSRWVVLETGADVNELAGSEATRRGAETELDRWCGGRVVLNYMGNLGHVHDWETLARAVPAALEDAGGRAGLVVVASGSGVPRWREAWAGRPGDAIRFEEPLDDQAWARLLVRSSVALVTLHSEAAHTSIPSKTFSAMAAGNAILAVAPAESDLAALIRRHDCGRVVEPGDVPGAIGAMRDLLGDASELARCRANALDAARRHYHLGALAARWDAFLSEVEQSSGAVGAPPSEALV